MGAISIKASINTDNPTVTWVEDGPWDYRNDIAFAFIGGWVNYFGFMVYFPPAYFIDIPSLVCRNVDYEWPGTIDPATGDWQDARFTFTYSKPDVQEYGDVALDVSAEGLALPKDGGLYWYSGPDAGNAIKTNEVNPHRIIPTVTIRLRRRSPYLMLSPILTAVGCVNSAPLWVGGFSFFIERVLFTGAKVHKKYSSDGFELWEYDFEFVAKPYPWLSFYHKSGTFEYVWPPQYGYFDHNWFFS